MGIVILLGQCLAMFVASFLVGSLPLMFKSASSGKRLKAVSVFGMGILVGAALTIIIPEGVSTLYKSLPNDEELQESSVRAIGISLLTGFALMLLIESLTPHPPHEPESPDTQATPRSSEDGSRPHPTHMDSHTPIIPKRLHVREAEQTSSHSSVHGLNATLGMVIHGAADGIALGASSLSESGKLGLIVFLAVLVHKGPTALGLTTTLLSLSLTPQMIRKRLLIFSFAAPLGAILTYLVVRTIGVQGGDRSNGIDSLTWWTGIALLFSGGSFLYVATVIQSLSSDDPHHHHAHVSEGGEDVSLGKYTRTGILVTGMVLPVLLSTLVGEDH